MTWQDLLNRGSKLLVVWSWSTLVLFVSVALAAGEETSCSLELIQSLHRQGRHAVVSGCSVMDFMNWDSGVDNLGLDSLLVDDWLYSLVDVVVYMLASDGSTGSLRGGGTLSSGGVLESTELLAYGASSLILVVVTELLLDLRD